VNSWTDWEVVRRQVAIGGRVVDDSEQPVAGAQVTITSMQQALRQKIDSAARAAGAGWQQLEERGDRTLTQADGLYFFLDLPAGKYTLQAIDRRSGLQAQKTLSVSWDQKGKVKAIADLHMRHQVAIWGRVVDDNNKPVAGAQVSMIDMPQEWRQKIDSAASAVGAGWQQLEERGDRTLTQEEGLYFFLDLPAGKYTLQAVDRRSGLQAQKTVSVSWDEDGNVKRAIADLKLPKARKGR
jgi:hypothetical protein